jgi:hypothetical protein
MECGHKNPAGVEFCTKCRAKMALECANCGFKSPQGSEFCGSCGKETEFGIKERARKATEAAAAKAREARQKENMQRAKQIAKKNAAGALLWVSRATEVVLLIVAGTGLVAGLYSIIILLWGDIPDLERTEVELSVIGGLVGGLVAYGLYLVAKAFRKGLEGED